MCAAETQAKVSRYRRWLAAGLVVAGMLVYANSFSGPFIFDDGPSIVENASLHSLRTAFSPPENITTTGRPLLNFTLALNFAVSGKAVEGYHVTNLLIHLLVALTLFGVIERTLQLPCWRRKWAAHAEWLAATVALLWVVHPLQTESVTYIVQRAESLVALCYLGVFYFFLRAMNSSNSGVWLSLSWLTCLAGMAAKEVMVSVPLMLCLYDRTFVAGTFGAAWRARGKFYVALASTWLLLIFLVIGTKGRGGSAGFSTEVSVWHYLLTQGGAIVHYLKLTFWPSPLVFDYGVGVVKTIGEVWWQIGLLGGMLAGSIWALGKRPVLGFLGLLFFAILAPSSSIVPIATQTVAEHRMYLPLAVPLILACVGLHRWLGTRGLVVAAMLAVVLGGLTFKRNMDYRTSIAMWSDVVAKAPGNPRGHYNLSVELTAAGKLAEAVEPLYEALRLKPDYTEALNNLGMVLFRQGKESEAEGHYREALAADPQNREALNNLGYVVASRTGRYEQALDYYRKALQLDPDYAEAHNNIGEIMAQRGELMEAKDWFEKAVRLKPRFAEAQNNLANILLQEGRNEEATDHYFKALEINPDLAEAQSNLAYVLLEAGRYEESVHHYRELLRIEPANVTAHNNLGYIAWKQGRLGEARSHYEETLRHDPANESARAALGQLARR